MYFPPLNFFNVSVGKMIIIQFLSDLIAWVKMEDYGDAKRDATRRIVRRQSRGNVNIQDPDGWYMTAEELGANSRQADAAMRRLRNAVAS